MTTKARDLELARQLRAFTARQLGKPPSLEFCVETVRRYADQSGAPTAHDALVPYLFDQAYP